MAQAERIVRDYVQRGHIERTLQTMPIAARRLRVAAYCRVSTDDEEQLNSYKTQVDYYTAFIQNKPEWEFAGIYADEGITGTSKRKRKEFLRLIRDALDGKIDYIICKSVSRFARNTVDILQTVRDLREKDIKIYFEKENIDSLDPKCDMILSIHASMAEEESRSISGNIRLGYKMRREKGIVSLNFNNIYGYKQDKEKNVTINEAEADVIRDIYFKYLLGYSYSTIADELTARGILTPLGNEKWNLSTVKGILESEKYVGDCLMQKTYKRDIHQPYAVKNKGQAPQKYIDNNHPPIVPRDIWSAAQAERERRKNLRAVSDSGKGRYDARYAFSGILFCGECGGNFRRHIHYIQGVEVPAWTCKEHLKGKHSCGQSPIKESYLEAVFVRTLNGLIQNRDKIISIVSGVVNDALIETNAIENGNEDVAAIDTEIENLQARILELNKKRSRREIDTENYNADSRGVMARLDELFIQRDNLIEQRGAATLDKTFQDLFTEFFSAAKEQTAFDREIFARLVTAVRIKDKTDIVFELKDGSEIKGITITEDIK